MNSSKLYFVLPFILAVVFASCSKECEYQSKYIYEQLVFDESCNCIVSGKVKYLKECQTVALVDYGNGICDNLATKTICNNGKCEMSAGAYTEEFEIDCQEAFKEGPISDKESAEIGI